uniref:NADH dehydrogenase subunit 5 n=1 Tax=Sulcionema specki TaxID=2016126 RepID=A0A6G5ZVC7_9EUGL|nr:NADH dehydrogenase subunit 5 [Sulcionema specki]
MATMIWIMVMVLLIVVTTLSRAKHILIWCNYMVVGTLLALTIHDLMVPSTTHHTTISIMIDIYDDGVLVVDSPTILMLSVVHCVFFNVMLFSILYMLYEEYLWLFGVLLLSFGVVILCYIMSSSMIVLVIMWEYLGVLSFLLIHYWGIRVLAAMASMKGIVLNRVLDILIMMLVIVMIVGNGTSQCSWLGIYDVVTDGIMSMLLMIAVGVKNVCVGLHTWLPDAMEGPTVVSAIIHAATLVIAGVVWITKILHGSMYTNIMVLVTTMGVVMYSAVATCCMDIKRVVAYSTAWHVSLLLLMLQYSMELSSWHLCIHAVFKSSLFIVMGCILHVTCIQDIRTIPKVVSNSMYIVLVGWCIHCSIGWLYTSGYLTKKIMVDLLWVTSWCTMSSMTLIIVTSILISVVYNVSIWYALVSGSVTGVVQALNSSEDVYICWLLIISMITHMSHYHGSVLLYTVTAQPAYNNISAILTLALGWWYITVLLLLLITLMWTYTHIMLEYTRWLSEYVLWDAIMSRTIAVVMRALAVVVPTTNILVDGLAKHTVIRYWIAPYTIHTTGILTVVLMLW